MYTYSIRVACREKQYVNLIKNSQGHTMQIEAMQIEAMESEAMQSEAIQSRKNAVGVVVE